LLLTFNGETYVYLPGSASNTIACTAPVGTASFAAYPTGGGAATTGAAVAGAFTLQTTGSWTRVDILDAGPTVIASFVASNSTSTGYTDAFAVVWTINRATAGRKTVAVTRPVWLFGTDDYMEVPDNALLNMDASQSFTVVAVVREWATPAANGRFVEKLSSNSLAGYTILNAGTLMGRAYFYLGDGTTTVSNSGQSGAFTAGTLTGLFGVRNTTTRTYNNTLTNAPIGPDQADTTTGSLTTTQPLRIGISTAFTSPSDMELLAVAVFRRALTATEIASINTYYGTA